MLTGIVIIAAGVTAAGAIAYVRSNPKPAGEPLPTYVEEVVTEIPAEVETVAEKVVAEVKTVAKKTRENKTAPTPAAETAPAVGTVTEGAPATASK